MAKFYDALTPEHRAFIARQPVFFVATAAADARVNLSPKGLNSFRVLDDRTVAYLDYGGSGNETNAHLLADGRITVMFCAWEGAPLIMRLYGRGTPVLPQDDGFAELAALFPAQAGVRQAFRIAVDSVQTSCGWGVPRMAFDRERDTMVRYFAGKAPDDRLAALTERPDSIDGLPTRPPTVAPGP